MLVIPFFCVLDVYAIEFGSNRGNISKRWKKILNVGKHFTSLFELLAVVKICETQKL